MQLPESIPSSGPPAPEIQPLGLVPPEDPPWNLVDVGVIMVFAVLSGIFVLALAIFGANFFRRFHHLGPIDVQNALILIPGQTVAYLLLIAFMVQIIRLKGQTDFLTAIGWNMPDLRRSFLALVGGSGLALLANIFSALFSRWMPKSVPVDKLFRDANSAYLLAIFGVLVAPVVEELFFRGFLFPALARKIGVSASIVFTAASFAVIHQSQLAHAWVPLLWLFVVGTVLTVARARTRSVATAVFIHVGYNSTLFTLLFIATSGFHHMERMT